MQKFRMWPESNLQVSNGKECFNGVMSYVGGIQFFVRVLQLLLIRFTPQNLFCISKSMMKHQQKLDWKLDPSWFHKGSR